MATTKETTFESRFRTPDARAAGRQFMTEAEATGLTVRRLNSAAVAIELDDSNGETPFSVIANNGHALVYLRRPALEKFPRLYAHATDRFGRVPPNQNGEYRLRVHNIPELDQLLDWLRIEGIWPWQVNNAATPLRRDRHLNEADQISFKTSQPTAFKVGELYLRSKVAEIVGDMNYAGGGSWDTGYIKYNGEFLIFCNIGVAGRTGHDYDNRWHDGRLFWLAKNGTRLDQPQIQELLSGKMPVHIFWRGKDRSPFTYAGLAVAEAAEDTSPVQVTWLLDGNAATGTNVIGQPIWHRGPPPSFSDLNIHRQEGPTSVYLMQLTGASSTTFPDMVEGMKLAKIGMSNDPLRRLIEMNSGFPRGCILRWTLLRAREYRSGPAAYEAEGALLERFRAEGKWLSNEFIYASDTELGDLLN